MLFFITRDVKICVIKCSKRTILKKALFKLNRLLTKSLMGTSFLHEKSICTQKKVEKSAMAKKHKFE